jgi:murein DD-endopeptidase MepM/ murein hydrolase activator NlpD
MGLLFCWGLDEVTARLDRRASSPYPVIKPRRFAAALARLTPALDAESLDSLPVPLTGELRRGENLSGLLVRLGLDARQAHSAASSLAAFSDLRKLRAGEPYTAYYDGRGRLAAFTLTRTGEGRLDLRREGELWVSDYRAFSRSTRTVLVGGFVEGALESSLERAGGPAALARAMAEVLQWDLDFNRDLRVGDHFRVLYDETLVDGRPHALAKILALDYKNRGKLYEAFLFGDGDAYYDGDGSPLRRQFLRSPLPYSRVTSRFSQRRYHPVLKIHRPHLGVDFGAPVGTPVRATAGGVVAAAGWGGGGGRMVKVSHPNDFVTSYLHLSRIPSHVRPGARVSQGDVIGYVGSTGLSTGPHLDYRVQHRGRFLDPLSLLAEPAPPLEEAERPQFERRRDELRRRLAVPQPEAFPVLAGGG